MSAPLPCVLAMLAAPETVRARTCWHEIGHVVVAKKYFARVEEVALHDDGSGHARVWAGPRILLRSQLGGFLNERLFLEPHQWSAEGADPDIAEASRLATEIFADECAKRGETPTPDQLVRGAGLMLDLDQELAAAVLLRSKVISRTLFKPFFDYGNLTEQQVNVLYAEGCRRQAEDDRRMRAAGTDTPGDPRITRPSRSDEEPAPEAQPGGTR